MILIPGPASQDLGIKIADLLRIDPVPITFRNFPDGEFYIRIEEDVEDKSVVIIQTTGPPQNENFMQLFLMADSVKDLNAKTINVVVPYFAYARQDKRFTRGEAFSTKTMISLLKACGVDSVTTINSHNPESMRSFGVEVEDLSAIGLLANHFKDNGLEGAFSLSLGKKAWKTAKQAHNVLAGGFGCIQTQRERTTGRVTIKQKALPVEKKDVIIFDDIISSGGTMIEAVKWAKELGARKVYVACVHPLLIGDAQKKILESGAETLVGTDSVSSPISIVSLAQLIAEALIKRGA